MRVVFTGGGTGGHLYPALAVARALRALRPEVEPFFVGARRGIEQRVLPESEFAHLLLDLHPLYRSQPWRNWRTLVGLTAAWGELDRAFATTAPVLGFGTGGYASAATLAWCVRRRVPFALQEQNSFPGGTTRLFSRWARAIYLGFPEAAMRLPRATIGRTLVTGNPVQPPPMPRPARGEARERWGFPATGGTVVLVFGGSQGSAALNAIVDGWIAMGLPDDVYVIWATGTAHHERYAVRQSAQVAIRPYLAPIADAYAAADLAVTRAGAMTTAELCAWGIPALLVPLPTAAADHQTANARSLADAGAARWLPERDATPARVAREVMNLARDRTTLARLAEGAARRARPDAAQTIAAHLAGLLGPTGAV